jgi:hypothetical protein
MAANYLSEKWLASDSSQISAVNPTKFVRKDFCRSAREERTMNDWFGEGCRLQWSP